MREPSPRRAQYRAREREGGGGEESGKLRKRVPVRRKGLSAPRKGRHEARSAGERGFRAPPKILVPGS